MESMSKTTKDEDAAFTASSSFHLYGSAVSMLAKA